MIRRLRDWFRKSMQGPPCPICGREMSPGYRSSKAIVDPMCPCPHPIMHIPTIPAPTISLLAASCDGFHKWLPQSGFAAPFTPTGYGSNDGKVRDHSDRVIADCFGNEAAADTIAAALNTAYFSTADV